MKKILAVDGNSVVNRAFYGVRPLSNKEGFPTNALFGMVGILEKNLEKVKPDYAMIAFDLKAPTFRHKMYAEYKAGRRPTPEDLVLQMPAAKELSAALGFVCLEKEGYEADDILGTIAAFGSEACEVYLLTGDRDALQLISDRVHVLLLTNTDTVDYTRERFFEKYGVDATQFVDVKALMGDSSDHIPGVPGIGEKTALKLIAEHGTLDGVYRDFETAKLTPSVRQKLSDGRESAYLSQKLATICCSVPISYDLDEYTYNGFQHAALLKLFSKFEFNAFIKRFGLTEAPQALDISEDAEIKTLIAADVAHYAKEFAFDVSEKGAFVCDGKTVGKLADKDAVVSFVKQSDATIICHDAKRIYKELEKQGVSWRGCAFDTMLAAYVLNPAEGGFDLPRLSLEYLGEQVKTSPAQLMTVFSLKQELSQRIHDLGAEDLLFDIEMPLCRVLTDMELLGFCVDGEGLATYGKQLSEVAEQLAARIYFAAGGEFNINSPKQLGEVLFERLGLPHGKKTKTGYSTNAEVLEKLRSYHSVIEDILDYRQVTKLNSTYAEGLQKQIEADGRIHTVFKQTGTATGRLSSAEPNLQNIPIRTELGKELRRYFISKNSNYLLIDADYSQIELRLLAAMANDTAMIEAFKSGEDIHATTAANVFGVPLSSVTAEQRKRAKAVNFGILYGMGAHSLSEDLNISMAQAREYIANYFAAYPGIDAYLKGVVAQAKEQGFVTTLFGRRRYIPELKMQNKNMQHFGERVAMNSPIQGTAADIIKIAMIRVDARLKEMKLDARLVLQVHDELIIEAHKSVADAAMDVLISEMENAIKLAVTLKVGAAKGANWYDSH